jgi:zinc carboxypeptidase
MARDSGVRICLLPPQDVQVELCAKAKTLTAQLRWSPPRVNAQAVGGYHVERTSWWPGDEPVTTRLTARPVRRCTFRDTAVAPDQVNEYRVTAVSKAFAHVASVPSFPAAAYGFAFMRYAGMVTELKRLARQNPGICRLVDAGPTASSRHRVWCMVLGTDTTDLPDRPGVFLAGNPHASELEGGDTCMGLVRELVRRYRAGDAAIRSVLEAVQIRIIPLYNPYGREANERGFPGSVRKTHPGTRLAPPADPLLVTDCWPADMTLGIDPNRTFDADWRYSGQPRDPASSTYPGERPFAAPETRSLVKMALALRPQISVNFHGPSGFPLLPGTWSDGVEPVDRKLHYEVGRAFATLSAPAFTCEVARLSPTPCHVPGEVAQAWFYKEFYGAHLLPEGFYEQVPIDPRLVPVAGSHSIEELVARNMDALVWMAGRVQGAGVTVRVKDERGRPVVAQVTVVDCMDPHCSDQYTDKRHGVYRRILSPGRYTLRITRCGRQTCELKDVRVRPDRTTPLEVVSSRQPEGGRT